LGLALIARVSMAFPISNLDARVGHIQPESILTFRQDAAGASNAESLSARDDGSAASDSGSLDARQDDDAKTQSNAGSLDARNDGSAASDSGSLEARQDDDAKTQSDAGSLDAVISTREEDIEPESVLAPASVGSIDAVSSA